MGEKEQSIWKRPISIRRKREPHRDPVELELAVRPSSEQHYERPSPERHDERPSPERHDERLAVRGSFEPLEPGSFEPATRAPLPGPPRPDTQLPPVSRPGLAPSSAFVQPAPSVEMPPVEQFEPQVDEWRASESERAEEHVLPPDPELVEPHAFESTPEFASEPLGDETAVLPSTPRPAFSLSPTGELPPVLASPQATVALPLPDLDPTTAYDLEPQSELVAPGPESKRASRARSPRLPDVSTRRYKSLVGLKIGSTQIAAAHVANGGAPRVLQIASEPLGPGIVVGGEVRRVDDLAEALKAFFKKYKLPRSPVRLGIANNRIGVRVLELTGIEDPKQLGNAVRFRAQEVLPIALEEAVLDYTVLREEIGSEGQRVHKVLLVVAHRELVEGFATACRKAGLKLVGIDLEAFGLLRALTPPVAGTGAGEDSALVVVSIGHDRSTLAVSDGQTCDFTRVLEWGGAVLDAAIARALDVPGGEAEEIRQAVTLLDGGHLPEWLAADQAAQAQAAMRSELQSFARDLVASLRFYQEQPESLGIAEILLAGGCSQLPGLDSELSRLIGVSVRVADPLTRASAGRKLGKETPTPSLTAAIGLGIED